MKSLLLSTSASTNSSYLTYPFAVAPLIRIAIWLLLGLPFYVACQTDNFDDGDAVGWSGITATNFPANNSFPSDSFGGKAYRLQGGTPPGTVGAGNTARVAAYRSDRSYTNFYVAADILAWDTTFTNDQAFGVMARANNVDSGFWNAAILVARINRFLQTSTSSSRGQVYIYNLVNGTTPNNAAAAAAECTLVAGHQYRFVFIGTNDGAKDFFTGLIYDLEDLTRPLVSLSGDSVLSTLFQYPWPSSGYSGVFNFNLGTNPADRGTTTDTTFDNFVASDTPPASIALPATPHGVSGAPQVVNRSPASFANFHPASSGITFNATTLTTTNAIVTNAMRFYLNDVEVSQAVSIAGPTTNATVSYGGLASNAVYDARIELTDALGRKTTNAWTFDTFDEGFLDSGWAKNIESEDYDFESGSFLDNPLPSGYPTNGGLVINAGVGYVDLLGSNAKPPLGGVDYFDYDSNPQARENEFRFSDSVGTQQGTADALYSDGTDPSVLVYNRVYETQRRKYASADPALQEYMVRRTEGGEWLNYTRTFTGSNYYNVYLRAGCRQPQVLWLGALPNTNDLGSFMVSSAISQYNYRYVPLRDNSGKLAVVNLSGTNTLRLTVGGPQMEGTKQGISMNYLAFVPAMLVESSPQVDGTYAIETGASVEPGTRRVTVPISGSTQFFRLKWYQPVRITSIRRVGGNVELTYQ